MAGAPEWFDALVERARAADGQPPFSDQSLVDLRTGERQLLALGEYAAAIVAPTEAELLVDPDARGRGHGTALIEAVLSAPRQELLVWAHGDHPAARSLAARFGFEPVRRLLQLRRPSGSRGSRVSTTEGEVSGGGVSTSSTTGTGSTAGTSSTVGTSSTTGTGSTTGRGDIRSFRPGQDEAAWLALNAKAFAFHPEQGSVDLADLQELEAEPWFEPHDFLVLVDDEVMIGYCWLKLEGDIGELYVVGVDPDRQGEGLGRRLVAAGLDRLDQSGVGTAALYVEADNTPALRLYESFGFAEHTVDIQYRLTRFTRR